MQDSKYEGFKKTSTDLSSEQRPQICKSKHFYDDGGDGDGDDDDDDDDHDHDHDDDTNNNDDDGDDNNDDDDDDDDGGDDDDCRSSSRRRRTRRRTRRRRRKKGAVLDCSQSTDCATNCLTHARSLDTGTTCENTSVRPLSAKQPLNH